MKGMLFSSKNASVLNLIFTDSSYKDFHLCNFINQDALLLTTNGVTSTVSLCHNKIQWFVDLKSIQNHLIKSSWMYFPIEVVSPNKHFANLFIDSFAWQVFSVRILHFGLIWLELPTPVTHPPSEGTCWHSCGIPTPKIHLHVTEYYENFVT